eukprot:TRINITY_DN9934_c0_g2_i2.p1 TRINITY_DN9934_c0_g2~~TRINITY_DN9934_c0_g2_i2.p1  ORF type:complete len:102 (+),score=13.71 TRINITY_DN9934_c0_g2_i2:493-798(+)
MRWLTSRVVSFEDLTAKGKEFDATTMELSAKTGANVKELFDTLVQRIPGTEISQNFSMTSPNYQNSMHINFNAPQDKPNIQLSASNHVARTPEPTKKGSCC